MIVSKKFQNRTYYVVGLGRTGIGAVNALLKSGASIFAWDDNAENRSYIAGSEAKLIEPSIVQWKNIDCVVLSPGIPTIGPKVHEVVRLAKENSVPITSDLDLLYEACPNATYVGITGTNGKSTTTALVGHILKECRKKVCVGGNIGLSVMELEELEEDGFYVIEASSYQLDITRNVRFNFAALLNITPDHLDRHLNMENYVAAKARIFSNQLVGDAAIISKDYEQTRVLIKKLKLPTVVSALTAADVFIEKRIIHDGPAQYDLNDMTYLPGKHNEENILAAYTICKKTGIKPEEIIAAIKTFKGLAHRIESVLEKDGLKFINDSKATNADAAQKALECFNEIYWIVGGVDKSDGIDSLMPLMHKVKKAYLIGNAQERFADTLDQASCAYKKCGTLEAALLEIKKDTREGVVLLSPACASFDQFKDFEDRGDIFKKLVLKHFG